MALRPRYTSNMAAEGRIGGGQPRYRRRRDARASLTSPQTQRSSFLSAPTALLRLKRSPPTLLCSPPLAVHSLPFYFMLRVSLSPFLSLFLPLFLSFRLSHRSLLTLLVSSRLAVSFLFEISFVGITLSTVTHVARYATQYTYDTLIRD